MDSSRYPALVTTQEAHVWLTQGSGFVNFNSQIIKKNTEPKY